jgi:hypothetical protein
MILTEPVDQVAAEVAVYIAYKGAGINLPKETIWSLSPAAQTALRSNPDLIGAHRVIAREDDQAVQTAKAKERLSNPTETLIYKNSVLRMGNKRMLTAIVLRICSINKIIRYFRWTSAELPSQKF